MRMEYRSSIPGNCTFLVKDTESFRQPPRPTVVNESKAKFVEQIDMKAEFWKTGGNVLGAERFDETAYAELMDGFDYDRQPCGPCELGNLLLLGEESLFNNSRFSVENSEYRIRARISGQEAD